MATTPATVAGTYGITNTLENYTIESENITKAPQKERVPDQKNAEANEITYDTRIELRLTVRGASAPSGETITYNSVKYAIDSVEEAGTYNGLKRYNIVGHRCDNYPA